MFKGQNSIKKYAYICVLSASGESAVENEAKN